MVLQLGHMLKQKAMKVMQSGEVLKRKAIMVLQLVVLPKPGAKTVRPSVEMQKQAGQKALPMAMPRGPQQMIARHLAPGRVPLA